jgi:hypothetical protein
VHGTFVIHGAPEGRLSGHVVPERGDSAFVLKPTPPGAALRFARIPKARMLCHPRWEEAEPSVETAGSKTVLPSEMGVLSVLDLRSDPAAESHFYLDFDGEQAIEPNWNGGKRIDAALKSHKKSPHHHLLP